MINQPFKDPFNHIIDHYFSYAFYHVVIMTSYDYHYTTIVSASFEKYIKMATTPDHTSSS